MFVTAFNTSSSPVTVDGEGRQVGARDWGTVETTTDQAKAALEGGSLVVVDTIPDDGHPDAVAARDRTEAVAARAEAFAALDKSELTPVAVAAGVPGAEDAYKPDLVLALASRLELAAPPPRPADTLDDQQEQMPEPPAENPAESKPAKQTSRRAGRE